MTVPVALAVLPNCVGILVKVVESILDPVLLRNSLRRLASLPKPPVECFDLDSDQRDVIIAYVPHSRLKSTAVLTSFTSLFASTLIVFGTQGLSSVVGLFLVFFLLVGIAFLLLYVLPKEVYFFSMRGFLGLEHATWIVFSLCLYDILLAGLSVATIISRPQRS